MKILYSCLSQSWGGMEMFTIDAVKRLLKRGIHTELLCYPGSKIEMKAREEAIITYPVKAKSYFEPSAINKIRKILSVGNFDLAHTQASKDLWAIVPALKISGEKIPLVLTKQMGSFIVKKDFLHRALYSRIDEAFAISGVIAKNLVDTTPIPPEKIKIIYNGVDVEKFTPENPNREKVREEFNVLNGELLIGMTARFTPGKGHEEFIYASEKLSAKYDNIKFVVIGEPSRGESEYAEKIRASGEKLTKEKKLIFAGFRGDMPDMLSALDLFVFPSHAEAFGIALAEAMAAGKACAAAGTDGPLDIIDDGINGLFFEPQNKNDLIEKIEELITNPQKRERFGKAAREKAVSVFDIEKLTDKALSRYEELIEKRRRSL